MRDIDIVDLKKWHEFYDSFITFNVELSELYNSFWNRLISERENWRDSQFQPIYDLIDKNFRPGIESYLHASDAIATSFRRRIALVDNMLEGNSGRG